MSTTIGIEYLLFAFTGMYSSFLWLHYISITVSNWINKAIIYFTVVDNESMIEK